MNLSKYPVKRNYLRSLDGLLLFCMGIPSVVVLLVKDFTGMTYQFFSIIQMFFYMRLFRNMRLLRQITANDQQFEYLLSAADIVLFVFTFACVFNSVESNVAYSFWDSVYFAMATVSTTGYGDVVPHTNLGRVCTIIMITFVAVWLPSKVIPFMD